MSINRDQGSARGLCSNANKAAITRTMSDSPPMQFGPGLKVLRYVYHRMPRGVLRILRAVRFEVARIRQERWYTEWDARRECLARAFEALEFNGITGAYAEFGSWSGQTMTLAYQASRRVGLNCLLWAFDSFQGLPPSADPRDAHRKWQVNAMTMPLEEFHATLADRGVPRDAYRVVPGFYEKTLRLDDPDLPTDIALAYIDCDMYSSTASVLRFLAPRLKHGMILALDDYFCYSPTQTSGEKLAFEEFFEKRREWRLVPYRQYGSSSQAFVLERA
jgi:O-methyltransferase